MKRFCEDVKLEQVLKDSSISFVGFLPLHFLLLLRFVAFIDNYFKWICFNLMKVFLFYIIFLVYLVD